MIEATVADSADNAEVALEKKHEGEMLRVALTKLSPEHREIIDLVYYHENSVDDARKSSAFPRHREDPHVLCPQKVGRAGPGGVVCAFFGVGWGGPGGDSPEPPCIVREAV